MARIERRPTFVGMKFGAYIISAEPAQGGWSVRSLKHLQVLIQSKGLNAIAITPESCARIRSNIEVEETRKLKEKSP